MTSILYKAYDWIQEIDEETKEMIIYSIGKTTEGKTVMIRIEGFQPFVYLELPQNRRWTEASARDLYDELVDLLKDNAPVRYKLCKKFMIEYKRPSTHLMLVFKSQGSSKILEYRCKRKIGEYPPDTFKVHEQNIDPLIKFMALRKITPCGWIQIDEYEEEEFSTSDISATAKWSSINPSSMDEHILVPMKIASFDIECYSKNHNSKHPDALIEENIVFQISFHIMDTKTKEIKLNLLSLYDCPNIEGATVYNYTSEKNLLLGFTEIVNRYDPDVILSYNGIKFDWDYLITRANKCGIYPHFSQLGRLIGKRAILETRQWHSSAYGEQNFHFLHPQGRINIDMMIDIERAYKLDKYSLNFVANRFLGEQKEDVSPLQLFKLVEIIQRINGLTDIEKIKGITSKLVNANIYKGVVKTVNDEIMNATSENIQDKVKLCIHTIGTYCVKDSILPIKLYEYHNTYTTLEQLSNICGVPITYLQIRGQQIKVVAQLYRETMFNNIVISYKAYSDQPDDKKIQGAVVLDAIPGYYENITVFDFESLYPTTMISKNICYTTLIHPNDPISDDKCNICSWCDHVGCEHDPKHRKREKEYILCDTEPKKYRFLKVTYDKDGTPHGEGILPKLLRCLLNNRKEVKREIKVLTSELKSCTDETKINETKIKIGVLDAKQRALKVSANSMYGFTGARRGMLPFIEGASSTTAIGRDLITNAIEYIKSTQSSVSLVYGDTDSCMWKVDNVKNISDIFALSKTISKTTTDYLKRRLLGFGDGKLTQKQQIEYNAIPINLEFEKVYKKYLLLTMKRYIGYVCDVNGKITEFVSKGVVSVRRDNCVYARELYNKTVNDIFSGMSKEEVMRNVYESLHDVARGIINPKHLSIFVSIRDVGIGEEGLFTIKSDKDLTEEEKCRIMYGEYDKDSHSIHVMLARHMIARGDIVVPNTRLEYILLKTNDKLQGNKAEDYTYYLDNKSRLDMKIDHLFYLEKKFNQLNELLIVKFPPKTEVYQPLEERIMDKVRGTNDAEIIDNIVRINKMDKRVKYILHNYDNDEHKDLIELCKRWKADDIITRLYKQFGNPCVKRRKQGVVISYDNNPISSVHKAHKAYNSVIQQLKELFSPFNQI